MMTLSDIDQHRQFQSLLDAAIEKPTASNLNRIRKIAEACGMPKHQLRAWLIIRMPWSPQRKVECKYDRNTPRIPCALSRL